MPVMKLPQKPKEQGSGEHLDSSAGAGSWRVVYLGGRLQPLSLHISSFVSFTIPFITNW
jgi:hypothetical protein